MVSQPDLRCAAGQSHLSSPTTILLQPGFLSFHRPMDWKATCLVACWENHHRRTGVCNHKFAPCTGWDEELGGEGYSMICHRLAIDLSFPLPKPGYHRSSPVISRNAAIRREKMSTEIFKGTRRGKRHTRQITSSSSWLGSGSETTGDPGRRVPTRPTCDPLSL